MSSLKQLKAMKRAEGHQEEILEEFSQLVKDIDRCDKTIIDLKTELEAVNLKHKDRRTTREDIAYLEDLLKCAHKKLTWEKHMASLQKRTLLLLERVSHLINDPVAPPDETRRVQMLQALQAVQASMERLQSAKIA